MAQPTEIPPRARFERSAAVNLLVTHLRNVTVGQVCGYAELLHVAGNLRTRTQLRGPLYTAFRALLADHMVFDCVTNTGYVRVDDPGKVKVMRAHGHRARRQAKRVLRVAKATDGEPLSALERQQYYGLVTVAKVTAGGFSTRGQKRLMDSQASEKPHPMAKLLAHYIRPATEEVFPRMTGS